MEERRSKGTRRKADGRRLFERHTLDNLVSSLKAIISGEDKRSGEDRRTGPGRRKEDGPED